MAHSEAEVSGQRPGSTKVALLSRKRALQPMRGLHQAVSGLLGLIHPAGRGSDGSSDRRQRHASTSVQTDRV